jgi:hypothetical protein
MGEFVRSAGRGPKDKTLSNTVIGLLGFIGLKYAYLGLEF